MPALRQAGAPLPLVWVVDPNGNVRSLPCARNIAHHMLQYSAPHSSGGVRVVTPAVEHQLKSGQVPTVKKEEMEFKVHLKPEYREAGWAMLHELYGQDSRPMIRDQGYQAFLDWDAAISAGASGTRTSKEIPKGSGGTRMRLYATEFPEQGYPEEVIRRKRGESALSKPAAELPKWLRDHIDQLSEAKPKKPKAEAAHG